MNKVGKSQYTTLWDKGCLSTQELGIDAKMGYCWEEFLAEM
jgi:hypothetical protein